MALEVTGRFLNESCKWKAQLLKIQLSSRNIDSWDSLLVKNSDFKNASETYSDSKCNISRFNS